MTCDDSYLHGASSSFRSARGGSATTTDPLGHNKRCCWPLPHAFSSLWQLCHGYSSCRFHLLELSLQLISLFGIFYSVCSIFRFHCGCQVHKWGLSHCDFSITTLWSIPVAGICASWCQSMALAMSALSGCSPYYCEWLLS